MAAGKRFDYAEEVGATVMEDLTTARTSKQSIESRKLYSWNSNRRTLTRQRRRKSVTTARSCTRYRDMLQDHTWRYCQETTLHGVRYITTPRYLFVERLVWFAVCVICVSIAVSMMKLVWSRFQNSPTVTTVETTTYPIWNIPFPAITLCNNNKVYRSSAENLATNLSRAMSANRSLILQVLKMLPSLISPRTIDTKQAEEVQQLLFKAGYSIPKLMMQLAPPCEKMILKCQWLDRDRNCSDIFHLSKSVQGICCSFNYRALRKKLRIDTKEHDESMHFVSGAGLNAGLTVVLDIQQNEYFAPLHSLYGISVLFHDPLDYPETSLQTAIVGPGQLVTVSLSAEAIESVSDVRVLNVAQRQCWFDDEVEVIHSSVEYSYQTCVTECRMRVLNIKCGCTPFFYPLFNESSRVCTLLDSECLKLNRRLTAGMQPEGNIPEFGNKELPSNMTGMNCSCLPQCTDKSYVVSVETAVLEPELESSSWVINMHKSSNISMLSVFFRDITCMKYSRNAYMTWDAVFATFGGIFGLCMGGSVISLFELGYRLLLFMCAVVKEIMRPRNKHIRRNTVRPWNIEIATPHHMLSNHKSKHWKNVYLR